MSRYALCIALLVYVVPTLVAGLMVLLWRVLA